MYFTIYVVLVKRAIRDFLYRRMHTLDDIPNYSVGLLFIP